MSDWQFLIWINGYCRTDTVGDTALEIRQVFEAVDFGAALTPELREQEARVQAQIAARDAE